MWSGSVCVRVYLLYLPVAPSIADQTGPSCFFFQADSQFDILEIHV